MREWYQSERSIGGKSVLPDTNQQLRSRDAAHSALGGGGEIALEKLGQGFTWGRRGGVDGDSAPLVQSGGTLV